MKFEDALDLMLKKEQLTLTGYYYLLSAYKQSVVTESKEPSK